MYKSAATPPAGDGAQPQPTDGKPADKPKDDVVDAEFVDVEDKKK
jgi:hypothetical protein